MTRSGTGPEWFTWNPTSDTVAALATALIMICGGYYLLVHLPEDSLIQPVYRFIFESLLVIFPVWWMIRQPGHTLRDLGITKEGWKGSLIISLLLSALFLFYILHQYSSYGWGLVPHLIANGIILWEPFFLFSWLQLRFDKAFGIIPAILMTGICLGAYHIGTYPLSMILVLAGFGILFAALFRITSNILIMWPLTWSLASAEGTLKGGFIFGWDDVLFSGLILIVQAVFILSILKKTTPPPAGT
jgi:hypothetical protein